jgi:hypothetical protein
MSPTWPPRSHRPELKPGKERTRLSSRRRPQGSSFRTGCISFVPLRRQKQSTCIDAALSRSRLVRCSTHERSILKLWPTWRKVPELHLVSFLLLRLHHLSRVVGSSGSLAYCTSGFGISSSSRVRPLLPKHSRTTILDTRACCPIFTTPERGKKSLCRQQPSHASEFDILHPTSFVDLLRHPPCPATPSPPSASARARQTR